MMRRECDHCGGRQFEAVEVGEYVDLRCAKCETPHGNGFREAVDDDRPGRVGGEVGDLLEDRHDCPDSRIEEAGGIRIETDMQSTTRSSIEMMGEFGARPEVLRFAYIEVCPVCGAVGIEVIDDAS